MPSKRQKTTSTRARTTHPKTISSPPQLPPSTFSTRILTNDLVLKSVCNCLPPVSLVRLGRTCKQAKASVESYISLAFNFNKYLERFFPEALVPEFRSLQARTTTLVAGTSALEFFDRSVYEECNLELFTHSAHGLEVGRWLQQNGYTYKPRAVADQDAELDVAYARSINNQMAQYTAGRLAGIFLFVKASPKDPSKELQIQVTVAANAPIEVILRSYSTITLNVIAWDTAYALYPRTTLEDKHALFLDSIIDREGDVSEWVHRGWKLHQYLSSVQYDSAFTVGRWIGDSQSWVLKLPLEGVTPPSSINPSSPALTKDPSYMTSWTIEHNEDSGFPMIWTRVLEHTALFYRYTVSTPSWDAITKLANAAQGDAKFEKGSTYVDQTVVEFFEKEIEGKRSWLKWPGPQPLEGSEKESDDDEEYYDDDFLEEMHNGFYGDMIHDIHINDFF